MAGDTGGTGDTGDMGGIIRLGFNTWKNNFQIGIPFLLNMVLIIILGVVFMSVIFFTFFEDAVLLIRPDMTPEELVSLFGPVIKEYAVELILSVLIFILAVLITQSYFLSGAIGMAKVAIEKGTVTLADMTHFGSKNFINMFFFYILIGLMIIAGIVFIVPGALRFDPGNAGADPAAPVMLFLGIILWIIYALAVFVILAAVPYILVTENTGPVDSLLSGYRFFTKNRMYIVILSVVSFSISIGFAILSQLLMIFFPDIGTPWEIIDMLITSLVIGPLITIWWTGFYMVKSGRKP